MGARNYRPHLTVEDREMIEDAYEKFFSDFKKEKFISLVVRTGLQKLLNEKIRKEQKENVKNN